MQEKRGWAPAVVEWASATSRRGVRGWWRQDEDGDREEVSAMKGDPSSGEEQSDSKTKGQCTARGRESGN